MASTFRLKRKTYSDDQQREKNSGWGKKLAIGAGIAAAGFAGAKSGMLGAGAQKWAGSTYAKAGKLVGSQGMIKSGAASYGQGAAKQIAERNAARLAADGSKTVGKVTEQVTNARAQKLADAFINKLG